MFIRYAAFHLQQLSAKRQRDTNEQKSIEANKDSNTKESTNEAANKDTTDTKSQEKEPKGKKEKKEVESAKKEDKADGEAEVKNDKGKDDELLLNENYSEIDTDVAKKIVESITDSICSGDKQESDCEY